MIFFDQPARRPQVAKQLDASYQEIGTYFTNRLPHDEFYQRVFSPKSNRWVLAPSGKSGTTTALDLLFQLEFGHRNTAAMEKPGDLNPDQTMHETVNGPAGVFRPVIQRNDISDFPGFIRNCTYIATVREPLERAWSSFRYLCRTHDRKFPQFAHDRIRMCAAVGFDWDNDTMTKTGFERFLSYVEMSCAQADGFMVNSHWRPQWINVRPDIFNVDILARVDDVAGFGDALEARFERPLIHRSPKRNENPLREFPEWLSDAIIRRKIRSIYEQDYEFTGYSI